jgi:hypothetical protein
MCSRDATPAEADDGDGDTGDATPEQAQSPDTLPKPPQRPRPSDDPFLGKHL